MKCEEYRILLEDYLDGSLDSRELALVRAHVMSCAACAGLQEELIREQEVYSRYERDVEITPMLWSSIEARIKRDRAAQVRGTRLRERFAAAFAARRLSPAWAAALVVIAIGITVAVMSFLNSRNREVIATANRNSPVIAPEKRDESPTPAFPNTPENNPGATARNDVPTLAKDNKAVSAPRRQPRAAEPTPAQLVQEAEQKYLTAIAILSRDVNRRRSELDPTVLARFDASLSEIDRTIRETRRVVRENPEDPIALQYLLAAYSKKVEVLRGMTTD